MGPPGGSARTSWAVQQFIRQFTNLMAAKATFGLDQEKLIGLVIRHLF